MKELGSVVSIIIFSAAICFFVKPVETAKFFGTIVYVFNQTAFHSDPPRTEAAR